MPPFGPISRRDLIHYLRKAGFEGPFPRGKHEYVMKRPLRLPIPNPHRGDIGKNLLPDILRQAGISREDWERL